jgi:hypothetical protein
VAAAIPLSGSSQSGLWGISNRMESSPDEKFKYERSKPLGMSIIS